MKVEAKKIQDLENKLWNACNKLRGNLSPEEYMHVVIGILFLNQISRKYENAVEEIKKDFPTNWENKIKDTDRLSKYGCSFFVPDKSKWSYISEFTTKQEIGQVIDNAFRELEEHNPSLSGLFNKNYSREELDKTRLGGVISIFANIEIDANEDIMGRVYEYFLGKFFLDKGQKSGQFYTPKSIVSLIVNFIEPEKGIIYDPCCGTGGMFIQAKQHIEEQGKKSDGLIVYGQEFENTTWKLGKINLLLNGFDNDNIKLGKKSADTFGNDLHKGLKADFILANPPFNLKEWSQEAREKRTWKYGIPPKNNANYAWLQHIVEKLSPEGKAGVVLANGSLTTSSKEEIEIRKALIKENKISSIITLPDKLFFTTGISASIWFFDNNKKNKNILMIDAQNLGQLVEGSKKNKELRKEDLLQLTDIYKKFENNENIDIPGLAKSADIKTIEKNDFLLSPGRYITIKEDETKNKEEIKKELDASISELIKLMDESKELEKDLKKAIEKIKTTK